jgi:hypothetical protein
MEFVYVVKRYDLFDLEFPHGFRTAAEADLRSASGGPGRRASSSSVATRRPTPR